MKTPATFQKILSQKGQGLVEYALLTCFVDAIFLFVTLNGGFKGVLTNTFNSTGESLAAIKFNSDDETEGETSFDYETQTGEDTSSKNLKPLNWVAEIFPFANMTYNTILRSDTVDKALSSEIVFLIHC